MCAMQARERFRLRVICTAFTRTLVSCTTPLVTYIAPFRSSSTSNFFIMRCFAGDFDGTYAMLKTGCAMFLCYKVVNARNIDFRIGIFLKKPKPIPLFPSFSCVAPQQGCTVLGTHWLKGSFMDISTSL